MTVLILAQRKIKDFLPKTAFSRVDLKLIFPRSDKILISFLIIAGFAITAYLWSLYSTFQAGFILREQEVLLDKLDSEIKLKEVQVSNAEAILTGDLEILNGMEKVSSMRFIKTSSEVSYKQ